MPFHSGPCGEASTWVGEEAREEPRKVCVLGGAVRGKGFDGKERVSPSKQS